MQSILLFLIVVTKNFHLVPRLTTGGTVNPWTHLPTWRARARLDVSHGINLFTKI